MRTTLFSRHALLIVGLLVPLGELQKNHFLAAIINVESWGRILYCAWPWKAGSTQLLTTPAPAMSTSHSSFCYAAR